MLKFFLAATAMALSVSAANAASISSLVGDIDGFGGQTAAGAVGVDTGFSFDNTTGADPAFTDAWIFEQDGGVAGSPIVYNHIYALGVGEVVDTAVLSIMESGMSDGRGPWEVLFNGNSLGLIENGLVSTSTLHSFNVNTAWLTGSSDVISLLYQDTQDEGYAIDYSQLSLTTTAAVPLPATGLLLMGALGACALGRRKSKA